MDTNLIFQFRAIYESGTIARAAEQLNITPGALSRAMKRLEDELECSLFTPSGRNILPTEKAKIFYHSSEQVIKSIDHAKNSLKKNEATTREIKIATFEVFSTHFAAWMIQKLRIDSPITLFESVPGTIEKNILNGSADFGLTYIPELHSELDHLPIADMPIGVFISAKHINKELPFAVPITELGINHLQAKSLDGWPVDKHREIKYKFEMLETALDLATRGECKLLCPKFIVNIENERLNSSHQLIEEPQKINFPKFKIFAVKKKSYPEDEYFKKICKTVRMALSL